MNLGVALLRIVACYMVVSIHFGGTLPGSNVAVPLFMFLAFYFMNRTLEWSVLLKREKRILLPYLAWSAVGCAVASFMPWFGGWRDCLSQFVFGSPCNSPLYFMNDLMWITAIIFTIRYCFRKTSWLVLVGLVIASLCVQYLGLNNAMWKWLPAQGEILFGRMVELLPVAVFGFAFSFAHKCGKRCTLIVSCVTLVMYVACIFFKVLPYETGYAYGGLPKALGAATICMAAIILGELIPPMNSRLVSTITTISGLTAGIYYIHVPLGNVIRRLTSIQLGVTSSLLVFASSMVLIFILKQWKRTSVFVK